MSEEYRTRSQAFMALLQEQKDLDPSLVVVPVYRKSDLKRPAFLLCFKEFDDLKEDA